ncbi:MAG TPA: hypothetical protein PL071_07325 [Nitrosomonas sp.]|jgi:hypothetical protein|nr:hypothetical protein [Nitrosomonas sp.]
MIIPDNKKTVSIILSKMKPGGGESRQDVVPEQAIDDKDEALKAIAEDMIKAFEDKSAMDLVSALKAFWHQIQLMDEEQDEAQEQSEAE